MRDQTRFSFSVPEAVFIDGSKWHFDAESRTHSKATTWTKANRFNFATGGTSWGKDDSAQVKTLYQTLILVVLHGCGQGSEKKGQQTWRKIFQTTVYSESDLQTAPAVNNKPRAAWAAAEQNEFVPLGTKTKCVSCLFFFSFWQANKNLDMSINASNNFNLNITWSLSSTGNFEFLQGILASPSIRSSQEQRHTHTPTQVEFSLRDSSQVRSII